MYTQVKMTEQKMIDVGTFFADDGIWLQDGNMPGWQCFCLFFCFVCLFFILLIMSYGYKLETYQDGSGDKW